MLVRLLLPTALLVSIAACAPAPNDIEPTYVGDEVYQSLSCPQLEAQRLSIGHQLQDVSQHQNQSWFAADHKDQVAALKGHLFAVGRAAAQKSCPIAPLIVGMPPFG